MIPYHFIREFMIILLASTKGGAGKSTCCVQIAGALANRKGIAIDQRNKVLIVDSDPQQSVTQWHKVREHYRALPMRQYSMEKIDCMTVKSSEILQFAQKSQQLVAEYDHIIIDSCGCDTGVMRATMLMSDVIVIPLCLDAFDAWAFTQTCDIVNEAQKHAPDLQAIVTLNKIPRVVSTRRMNAMIQHVKEHCPNITLFDGLIHLRAQIVTMIQNGRTAADPVHPSNLLKQTLLEFDRLTDSILRLGGYPI